MDGQSTAGAGKGFRYRLSRFEGAKAPFPGDQGPEIDTVSEQPEIVVRKPKPVNGYI